MATLEPLHPGTNRLREFRLAQRQRKRPKQEDYIYVPMPGKTVSREEVQRQKKTHGLPLTITRERPDYHSCGCNIASLAEMTGLQPDGYIYADYRCSSNWSNIYRFRPTAKRTPRKLVKSSDGTITEARNYHVAPGAERAPNG